MNQRIRIIEAVSHERLDDEVIAIDLETGAYFAFDGPAADCWTIAVAGGSVDDIVVALTARYDVSSDTAAADAASFLESLVESGIARVEPEGSSPNAQPAFADFATRLPYTTPVVDRYEDLATLLLIDPIHEVDDAGWPLPAPEIQD